MLGIGTQVMRITGNVFNLLVMVNCAANFILYSAFSTKFRSTFSGLFCTCTASSSDSSSASRRRRCCCWPVHTYSSAAGRVVNPNTDVTGRYASLPACDRASAAVRPGGVRGASRCTASTAVIEDCSDVDSLCTLRHTTTTDKLVMSSPSAIEEDLDDSHITSL